MNGCQVVDDLYSIKTAHLTRGLSKRITGNKSLKGFVKSIYVWVFL